MSKLYETYIDLVKSNYAAYVQYVHEGRWIPAKHLLFVCDNVQRFIETDTGKPFDILIISMPPQHGKSQSITETLPSWFLGKWPEKRVIEVSYNDTFAQKFGRRNRDKIKNYGKSLFDIELSKVKDSNEEFELSNNIGGMISRGIMSGITGNPAELIIIDDPVKTKEEAESETDREKKWDEWDNSIKTRCAAGAKVIVIMTRWHEDDLAGRMIMNLPKYVKVINLPCEAEGNDILGRKTGEALFPEIGKGNDWKDAFKESYCTSEGKRSWQALYQGRPTAQEGNLIKRKWWKYYSLIPERFDQAIQSWDCAFKDSDGSDYVVGTVWGRVGADKYLLDLVRDHMDLPTTIQAVEQLSNKWPDAWLKLVEDKANGPAVIQMLQHKVPGLVGVNPEGSKLARVQAILPHIEAGNVYLPENATWLSDFVEECSAFPQGKNDDQVDSVSQALIRLINDYSTYQEPKKQLPWMFRSPGDNQEGAYIQW